MRDADKFNRVFAYCPMSGVFAYRVNPGGSAKKGDLAGYIDSQGYHRLSLKKQKHKAHRVAWLLFYGNWPDKQIDHINGNKLDNRISNLRAVTQEENNKNCKIDKRNKSGKTGVCWRNGKWLVRITSGRKLMYLGSFDCKLDACAARIRAEKRYGFHENHGRIQRECEQ